MLRSALLLVVSVAACSDDGGIGISLLEVTDLVESEGLDAGEVTLFVSRACFYSVTVDGTLLGSGKWLSGERKIRLGTGALHRCRNDVRVQVAAADGSAGFLDTEVWWCAEANCSGECNNGGEPDAGTDAGPVDPYPGPLCDPCTGPEQCGGGLNVCMGVGGPTGICGTECYGPEDCPYEGIECLDVYDYYGDYVGSACLPWPPAATCP